VVVVTEGEVEKSNSATSSSSSLKVVTFIASDAGPLSISFLA